MVASRAGYACESQQFEGRKFMSTSLNGKTIAFLVAPEGVERVELTESWKAVKQGGGQCFRVRLRRAGTARRCGQPRLPAQQRSRRCVREEFLRRRKAGCGDLPRAVDADRG